MSVRHFLALAALVLAACSDTGPIFPTPEHLETWVTDPAAIDPGSDRPPQLADPVARFRLARGERLSALRAGRDWGTDQTYLFGFDIRAERAALDARPVTVSRFLRRGDRPTPLVSVQVDARHGVTVMGRSCIPAAELGTWHRVETRIRLADNDSGFLEVFCDRRPVWAQSDFRTTLPPTCRLSEGCTTPVPRPARFEWQLGLIAPQGAPRAIAVDMQRIIHHRLFVIPHRVPAL